MLVAARAVVFAHQGGWDEMLFVLVPIGIFVLLLRMANKRAEALQAERLGAQDPATEDGGAEDADAATEPPPAP